MVPSSPACNRLPLCSPFRHQLAVCSSISSVTSERNSERWRLVQVTIIELRQFHEPGFVEHDDASSAEIEDTVLTQLLDHPIGVHAGDTERLANLLLRERHVEAVARHLPDRS